MIPGCPFKSRGPTAHMFIADNLHARSYTVYDIEAYLCCGWRQINDVPHELTFCCIFNEFP